MLSDTHETPCDKIFLGGIGVASSDSKRARFRVLDSSEFSSMLIVISEGTRGELFMLQREEDEYCW